MNLQTQYLKKNDGIWHFKVMQSIEVMEATAIIYEYGRTDLKEQIYKVNFILKS